MIEIKIRNIKDRSIIFNLEIPRKLRKYFLYDELTLCYNFSLREVPKSLLLCPALGYILPLAFATGTDISIDSVDKTFLDSLYNLGQLIKKMYPQMPIEKVKISVDHVIKNNLPKNNLRSAIFFSGGLDSTSLLLRHLAKKPFLITVWGADIGLDDKVKWRKLKRYVQLTANRLHLSPIFIAFNDILPRGRLSIFFRRELEGNDWWGGLAAGITLPSLAVPLVAAKNVKHIYISSGHTKEFTHPWSDVYYIYNTIKYANANIICDDYELSRFKRLLIIKRNLKKLQQYGLKVKIRSCNQKTDKINCGYCEKCARTIVMLMLAGMNPNEFGFDVNVLQYPQYLRTLLDQHALKLDANSLPYWLEIKEKSKFNQYLNFLYFYNFERLLKHERELSMLDFVYLFSSIFGTRSYIIDQKLRNLNTGLIGRIYRIWHTRNLLLQ